MQTSKMSSGIKNAIGRMIEDGIDQIFTDVHYLAQTNSGDIFPEQEFELERIKKELTELVIQQTEQNL